MIKNESRFVEYKKEIGQSNKEKKNFKAEISSFLNSTTGGMIFLGYDDNGKQLEFRSDAEKYIEFQKWEEIISNWITEGFEPDVRDLIFIDTSNDDFRIKILSGKEKPYYFTEGIGINYHGAYERIGSHKVPINRERFQYLLSNSAPISFDKRESEIQELTFKVLRSRLSAVGKELDFAGLNLLNDEKKYNNGAQILSDQNKSVTKISVYNDLNIGNTLERRTIEGKSIIESIDEVLEFIEKHNSIRTEIKGTAQRRDVSDYPEIAIREAVINAFAHRDYNLNSDILIVIYLNRIEISSPGSLPGGLTVADIREGANYRRNDVIVKSLNIIGYMENYA